jgi:serine/threonine protein kinase
MSPIVPVNLPEPAGGLVMNTYPTLHPTDQSLRDFGLGRLDGRTIEAVNQHLEACEACQRRVAALSSDSFLGRLRGANAGRGASAAGGPPAGPWPAATLPPELAEHADYHITRELGRGGMGVVYLAHNRLLGRDEVFKVVNRHMLNRPGVADRFLREVRAAAKLHHPNIVTAYSAFHAGDGLVLAMEYVEGLDLARLVKAKGPLPVAHACYFAHQAALGLQHAHERGMVHRDIKPGNLMLSRQGDRPVVKVLDFGLAKATREAPADGGLTHEGQMLGTPDYIAPEQIRDAQSADIRADIYSLGCTLHFLLSGEPPFRAASLYDLLQAHFSMAAGPLNLARPEVPMELAALVAKMMAKEPGRRPQTPGEVAKALAPFFRSAPKGSPAVRSSPETPQARSGERRWATSVDLRETDPSPRPPSTEAATPPPATLPEGTGSGPPPRRRLALAAAGTAALALLGVIVIVVGFGREEKVTVTVSTGTEARTEKVPTPAVPATPAVATPVDLLALIELPRACNKGLCMRQKDGGLRTRHDGGQAFDLRLPWDPPSRYRVKLRAMRVTDTPAQLGVVLVWDAGRVHFSVDWYDGENALTGLTSIGALNNLPDRPDAWRTPVFPPRVPMQLVFTVEPGEVRLAVNDRQIYQWQGDMKSVLTSGKSRSFDLTGIGEADYVFEQIILEPLGADAGRPVP